jgi:PAS domain S-box-containing protein
MPESGGGQQHGSASKANVASIARVDGGLLRLFVESVQEFAVVLLDPAGRISSWNAGAERILGYSADDIVGRTYARLFPPEEQAAGRHKQLLGLAATNGRIGDEGWRIRKDGSRFWADVAITALRDERGELQGFGTVTHDLGERRRIEEDRVRLARAQAAREEAEAARARVNAVLESISDAFVAYDRELRYTYVNARAEEMLGHPRGELLGRTLGEVFGNGVAPAFYEAARNALDAGEVQEIELYSAATQRWLETRIYPAAGGVSVYFRDVSERKFAEEALRHSRDELAAILDSVDDGILVQDATGQFLYVNETAARLLGVSAPEALLALPIEQVVARLRLTDEDGNPFPAEQLPGRRVLRGELVPALTLGFHDPRSGEERWCAVRSTPVFDEAGRGRLVVSAFHDITPQRRVAEERGRLLEAERQAREAAQDAVAVRDQFLSVAAHELRTPLTSLKGQIQIAQRFLQRGVPAAELDERLAEADRQADRLTRLVGAMLDVSRLAAGRFVVEPRRIALAPLVERLVALERDAHPERRYDLAIADPSIELAADEDRLEQVIVNLLQNARKYSPEDRPIQIAVAGNDEWVTVAVRDEGIGVPPDEIGRVFTPFHRADNVDRGVSGLGLGLFIAHEIVEAHGGTLTVESQPGEGSTFTVALPRSGPDAAARLQSPAL